MGWIPEFRQFQTQVRLCLISPSDTGTQGQAYPRSSLTESTSAGKARRFESAEWFREPLKCVVEGRE